MVAPTIPTDHWIDDREMREILTIAEDAEHERALRLWVHMHNAGVVWDTRQAEQLLTDQEP